MIRVYLLTILLIAVVVFKTEAQEKSSQETVITKIEMLKNKRSKVEAEEKYMLKKEIEAINKNLARGLVSEKEAQIQKEDVAKKRALNIKSRMAIIDGEIDLLERNSITVVKDTNYNDYEPIIRIGRKDEKGDNLIYIGGSNNDKPRKYDLRTKSDMVLAFGFNNATIEGENFNNSPYKFGGSRFFEIGWGWKTRVFKKSNFLRIKYGVSVQINGLKPKDNKYFVQNGNQTYLDEFTYDLNKSKLSVTNLVFPVHFEIGESKKIESENYIRYSTTNKFKFGIGGYAGINIGTRQKLKYKIDGDKQKDKIKKSYNTNDLVYGVSSYIAFGDVALYAKYDLSPIFKNQDIEQNNISLGLRFDMD